MARPGDGYKSAILVGAVLLLAGLAVVQDLYLPGITVASAGAATLVAGGVGRFLYTE